MKIKNDKSFVNPFHPGEILLSEFIEPHGWTQTYLAKELGWTRTKLNELINGKRGITAETALDLSDFLKTTADIWLNMQTAYDLDKARKKRKRAA